MDTLTQSTVLTVWWGSLVVFLVAGGVVVTMLTLIQRTARSILGGAGAIWTRGKLVANNTIQIPLQLQVTLEGVRRIRQVAGEIAGATASIQAHAERCPGCPHCVLGLSD